MGRNIVPVPMPDDMLEYVNKKENRCQYIRGLVRKDMNNETEVSPAIKKYIEELFENTLGNIQIKENESNEIEDYKEELNSIFDM